MSKPGTIHQLRANPTTPNPEHVNFLMQIDPCPPPACPHSWTINGKLLTPKQLDMAHRITLADALHIRDLMTLTQDQHVPEGIIGEAHGYPLIIIHDDEPPAA